MVFLLSLNVFAYSKLDQFFHSSISHQLCSEAIEVRRDITYNYLEFIHADESEVYFVYHKNGTSAVFIHNLDSGEKDLISFENTKIVDILIDNKRVIYLSQSKFIVVDRLTGSKLFESLTLPDELSYGKSALATAVKQRKDLLYVAHGTYGVNVYRAETLEYLNTIPLQVTQTESFHVSEVTGIEIKDNTLYMAVDDVTLATDSKAYEGLVLYDLVLKKFTKEIPVNQRREAYYKPRLYIEKDEMFVTNLNLIFRHEIKKIRSHRYMKPTRRVWKYPEGRLIGRSFIKKNKVYGCFYNDSTGQKSADVVEI